MRYVLIFMTIASLGCVGKAFAAPADAREVARINNCPPKKIDVYEQKIGSMPKTIYRVECVMPKIVGNAETSAPASSAMLIQCDGSLCELLRLVNDAPK